MSDYTIDNNIMHSGFASTTPSHPEGVPHLYVHDQYGLTQHNLTYNYLRSRSDKRPNIYSSSAWASSGFIGGSFSQPLEISWASLTNSIAMAMNMGMNGVNHWVTDVCGVDMSASRVLNMTEIEVCARWLELSAFLPMVNVKGRLLDLIETAPTTTYTGFIDAMEQRGPFTRYIYSQMFAANYTGGQLVYPLLYDYPEDDMALDNIEQTFMLGEAIKVSPVLAAKQNESDTKFDAYFPQGVWRNLNNWAEKVDASHGGMYHAMDRVVGQT
jgi:alpha-glucosidase (family GH31 glycosyl hydrolase)